MTYRTFYGTIYFVSTKNQNRGANAKGNQGSKWIRPWRRLAIYLRDGFSCAYCGRDLKGAPREEVTLDHLDCRTNGENHAESNLVTCCRSCNSSRQDKPWRQYATGGAIERIDVLVTLPLNESLAKAIIRGDAPAAELR